MQVKQSKKRELTELEQKFLDFLFSEDAQGNPTIAKELAGYSPNTSTYGILKQLSEEIRERAKQTLATYSGQAVWTLINMLGSNASDAGAMNKIKAAQEILNRAAIKENEESNTLNVPKTGLVILPAKSVTVEHDDGTKDITSG